MTPSELLHQARKYRAVALSLPPNLPPPRNKDYYLRMSEDLERQARAVAVARAVASTETQLNADLVVKTTTISCAAPAPAITLKKQTRIHSAVAVAVMNDKRPNIHRAFTIWLTLRQQARRWFSKSDVIEFYATQTGKHPRNVRRWLDAGDGVFWTFGRKNRLSLIGKNRVFASYRLIKPGRVLLVDTDKLLGKLQQARAAIYGCWLGGKNSRWASRSKFDKDGKERKFSIEHATGVSPRTQLNYDYANKQRKQYIYPVDWQTENGKPRQLPNIYHAVFYPAHYGQSGIKKRYGLYTPDTNGVTSTQAQTLSAALPISGAGFTVGNGRILYDNPNRAVAAARRRAQQGVTGQCFAVIGDTKRGNLLVKTLDYAAIA